MLAKISSLNNHQNKLTGSNKKVTNVEQRKSLLEFLSAVAEPPECQVCKKFLDDLLSVMKELDLDHIVAYSDEQFYVRIAHINRKDP